MREVQNHRFGIYVLSSTGRVGSLIANFFYHIDKKGRPKIIMAEQMYLLKGEWSGGKILGFGVQILAVLSLRSWVLTCKMALIISLSHPFTIHI